jgi:hypothetical protein
MYRTSRPSLINSVTDSLSVRLGIATSTPTPNPRRSHYQIFSSGFDHCGHSRLDEERRGPSCVQRIGLCRTYTLEYVYFERAKTFKFSYINTYIEYTKHLRQSRFLTVYCAVSEIKLYTKAPSLLNSVKFSPKINPTRT